MQAGFIDVVSISGVASCWRQTVVERCDYENGELVLGESWSFARILFEAVLEVFSSLRG